MKDLDYDLFLKKKMIEESPEFFWEEIMMWLKGFIHSYPQFTTDMLYCSDKISSLDKKYMSQLGNLFLKIKMYAKDNYIHSDKKEYGESFYVFFQDKGYEIGSFGEEGLYFCKESSLDGVDVINFDYLITGKKRREAVFIDRKLSILSSMIDVLYDEGIPLDAIKDIVDIKMMGIQSKVRIKEKNRR